MLCMGQGTAPPWCLEPSIWSFPSGNVIQDLSGLRPSPLDENGVTAIRGPPYGRKKRVAMRAVVQRVTRAQVAIGPSGTSEEAEVRSIAHGLVVLLGIGRDDSEKEAAQIAAKVQTLRIFADAQGKMNLDISQVGGQILLVSQFTLYADVRHGRRPSFERVGDAQSSEALYRSVVHYLRRGGCSVQTGEFGAHMLIHLTNDGPVTIILDTDQL
jgi:D-tyrosyl-tRNA(Tyr) deacylase